MRSSVEIKRIANGIYAEATEGINNLVELKKTQVAAIQNMGVDEGLAAVSALVADIEAIIKAPRIDGVGLPSYLSKITVSEETISPITITVRTKQKSAYKYAKSAEIQVDEDLVKNIGKVYVDALYNMFYIEQAIENVNELNAKVADIIKENEIPYSFEFVVNDDSDAMVLSISNDNVVFNADVTQAHNISDLGIFQSGDEYSDLVAKEATDKLVEALKGIQTTVQLVKGNVSLIKEVTGVSTKKRASKLIRESYHRQAKNLGAVKSGVGYFEGTTTVDGEEAEIFALVSKDIEGNLEVVLNPFDIKTLFNVEYDVIAEVKKQLA